MNKSLLAVATMLLSASVCFAAPGSAEEEKPSVDQAAQLLPSGITTVAKLDVQKNTYLIVKVVAPFSAAERWGIESNDRVLLVQANAASTRLMFERAGHVYVANFTPEASFNKLDVEAQSAASKIVGPYFGVLDNRLNVETTFLLSPEGVLSGTYHVDESGGYEGTLEQCSMYSPTAIEFTWHDRFGTGSFGANFSPDFKYFRGSWCPGIVLPVPATLNFGHPWDGMKR